MKFWPRKEVFLDYASITPLDSRVAKKMRAYESDIFANPSALYSSALSAKSAVEDSRKKIADILSAVRSEIIFTSGGTEGNNIALLGVYKAFKTPEFVPHFITTSIEHPSVLEVFSHIETIGGEVTYTPVDGEGKVNPKDIAKALKENTVLVSVMYVNNEIGTVQPIHEISRVLKDWKAKHPETKVAGSHAPYLHTDASQAALFLDLNIHKLGADLLVLDGIKMYGPRGIGVLFMRSSVKIKPIAFGGGQEKGVRSGTENVPAIVGLAEALMIAQEDKEKESLRLSEIRDYAISGIEKNFPKALLNGPREMRVPNNINFCFPGLDAEYAVIQLDVAGIAASYSSSCRTLKEDSSSYVIRNLGRENCDSSSLRFTLGRGSRKSDADLLIKALSRIVK